MDIAGSIMTIDDFYVDKSKEPLIESYIARVYKVFHVNIALCYDEDKLCTKICMSSADENGTSQNIKKAKVSKSRYSFQLLGVTKHWKCVIIGRFGLQYHCTKENALCRSSRAVSGTF